MSGIAFDVAASGGSTSGTSLSWSHTTTGIDRMIIVQAVSEIGSDLITGVTYGGTALIRIARGSHFNLDTRFTSLWYLIGAASGSNTVAVAGSSSGFIGAVSASYTGVGNLAHNNANSATGVDTMTLTDTVAINNSWTIAVFKTSTDPVAAGVGSVERINISFAAIFDSGGALSPGSNTMIGNAATTSNDWFGIIATFAPQIPIPELGWRGRYPDRVPDPDMEVVMSGFHPALPKPAVDPTPS